MNHLSVHLTEVDPFGNYSSPHYKGTAVFYKVSRGELEWRGDAAVPKDLKLLGDPVCKLSLTLPKVSKHSQRQVDIYTRCGKTSTFNNGRTFFLTCFTVVSSQKVRSISRPIAARVKLCAETGGRGAFYQLHMHAYLILELFLSKLFLQPFPAHFEILSYLRFSNHLILSLLYNLVYLFSSYKWGVLQVVLGSQ